MKESKEKVQVKRIAAQGDLIVKRVEKLPEGLTPVDSDEHIIAHSETGHHHVAQGAKAFYIQDEMTAYLVTQGPVDIVHNRAWNTHETFELLYDDSVEQGREVVWKIHRQEESAPEGWRRVED